MIRARAPWADHPQVLEAWSVPRQQTPPEWAAEHRRLTDKDSAEPGPWTNDRTPYLIEVMEAMADPRYTEVGAMKAAQVGWSEATRNFLGWLIDQDHGPVLIVCADESGAKEYLREKVIPLIQATPALAKHLTARKHDTGEKRVLLDHMEIHAAWATSPAKLASRPRRYLFLEEPDKYPAWSGAEADPIKLAEKRLRTFGHRKKKIMGCTPTTRSGPTWEHWERSPLKMHYHVPCPHCGEFAVMAWQQIRWPKDLAGTRAEQAEAIEQGDLAWYECPRCERRIDERQRNAMVLRGRWAHEGQSVDRAGAVQGERPESSAIWFHIPGFLSPWVSWSEMVAEFLRAHGDEKAMMDWRNSSLGLPYEIRAASVASSIFAEKINAGHKPGVAPAWAGVLLATADTQKDHFWWAVRAWGAGFRSRLIDYGRAATFDELRTRCLGTYYETEDGDSLAPPMLLIDSGGGDVGDDQSRTDQVYQFALTDPGRILASKGASRDMETPWRQSFVDYTAPGEERKQRVALYLLNSGYFKDILAARMQQPPNAADAWELHAQISQEYQRQMTSEHKVILRKGRRQVARWVKVSAGAQNHLWDCEVAQMALAQIAHVELLPTTEELRIRRRAAKSVAPADPRKADDWSSAATGGDW